MFKGSRLSFLLLPLALTAGLEIGSGAAAWAGQGRWTPVGPGKGIFGLDYGIRSVVTHPSSPGTVWAGLSSGGLYRSTDRGLTWTWAGRPFPGNGVRAVAADPSSPGALWAATKDGFFRTGDGGAYWARLSGETYAAALGGEEPAALYAGAGTPRTLYLRTERRLLASADGGAVWQTLFDAGESHLILNAVRSTAPAALYLVTVDSRGWDLLRSEDGGLTWVSLPDCPAVSAGIVQIAVSGNALLVAPQDAALGLLRSTDRGRTWRSVLAGGDGEDFRALTADPVSRTVVAVREQALWVSRDGGATWARRTERLPNPALGFAVGAEEGLLYAVGSGLSRSVNGGRTWNLVLAAPMEESPPSRVAFEKGNPSHMTLVVGHRLYSSLDGGRSWRLVSSPVKLNDVAIDPRDPNRMFGGGSYATAVTSDGGRTWTQKSWDYVELLEWSAGRTVFAGGCGVSISRDGGRTWRQSLPCVPPGPRADGRYVQKLEVDPAHPAVVYALTFLEGGDFYPNHGPMNPPSILWRSRDGGATWKQIGNELNAFALDRGRSRLYASRELDLFVSDDGGDHWRSLTPLPAPVTDLAVPPGLPDTLYAAALSALLRSQDGGRTWEKFDQGFAPGEFLLAVHPTDARTVYAQSWMGLFHIALP